MRGLKSSFNCALALLRTAPIFAGVQTRVRLKETWLSRRPRRGSLDLALGLTALCLIATFVYLNGLLGLEAYLAATPAAVFGRHEYWRAWTSLFVHADPAHLLSNAILFVPFSYFLAGHYPRWFYPGAAFLIGGLDNFAVLATMAPGSSLVGISGVVYWMGAAWLTLYLKIERRERLRTRFGKVVIVTAALFLPEAVRPEVSYASHYIGFLTGVVSALLLYRLKRDEFLRAERREIEWMEDSIAEEEWNPAAPDENKQDPGGTGPGTPVS